MCCAWNDSECERFTSSCGNAVNADESARDTCRTKIVKFRCKPLTKWRGSS